MQTATSAAAGIIAIITAAIIRSFIVGERARAVCFAKNIISASAIKAAAHTKACAIKAMQACDKPICISILLG
jgi:hypothetical protein